MSFLKPFKEVFSFPSDLKHIIDVEIFLGKIKKRLKLDEDQFNRLLVATTEAVNNSVIHGNLRDPQKKVTIICELKNKTLIVIVQDEGKGIDPLNLPNPLAEGNLLRENGRGIFLMRSLMTKVKFEKYKDGAAVVMTMKLR